MAKDFLKTIKKISDQNPWLQSNSSYSCPFELSKNPLSKFLEKSLKFFPKVPDPLISQKTSGEISDAI